MHPPCSHHAGGSELGKGRGLEKDATANRRCAIPGSKAAATHSPTPGEGLDPQGQGDTVMPCHVVPSQMSRGQRGWEPPATSEPLSRADCGCPRHIPSPGVRCKAGLHLRFTPCSGSPAPQSAKAHGKGPLLQSSTATCHKQVKGPATTTCHGSVARDAAAGWGLHW